MNLNNLKKTMPHKWRVQSFSRYKPEAICVAYVDSRDVQDLLDEVCGQGGWQDDYKDVGGLLAGGIGINVPEVGWVWKWDTGSESNVEKEKGHFSDTFKRAAVKWGIGRFLYSLKVQKVAANKIHSKDERYCDCYPVDNQGNRIWDLTNHINNRNNARQSSTHKFDGECNQCGAGADIKVGKDGETKYLVCSINQQHFKEA
jgi:hypothetical protein